MQEIGIKIVPKMDHDGVHGFVVKGRRPDSVVEWANATLAMAHYAIMSSDIKFRQPTFLAVHDDPLRLAEDTLVDIPVVEVGVDEIDRSKFGPFALGGAVVRVERELAIGALLFPGVPQLGIGHTVAVVHIEQNGTIHRMISDDNASPTIDPDIAVLSSILVGII